MNRIEKVYDIYCEIYIRIEILYRTLLTRGGMPSKYHNACMVKD